MRRGTRVGQAYVAITADGSGINEDIVDAVDEAGPEVERKGREHGEGYGEEFSEGWLDKMRGKIGDRLADRFRGMGTKAGDREGQDFAKAFTTHIEEMLTSKFDTMLGDLGRMLDVFESSVSGNRGGSGGGASDKIRLVKIEQATITRLVEAAEHNREALHAKSNETIAKADRDLAKAQNKIMMDAVARNAREILARDKATWAQRNASAKAYATYLGQLERGTIDQFGNALGRKGKGASLGDRVGAIFGAGSRNNVLNVLGKSIGGLINSTDRLRSGATSLFSTFVKGASEADGALGSLRGGLGAVFKGGSGAGSGIASTFGSIAASGPAAAVAIGVVVVAMSALASVISALIALVTALAAAVTGALVGALGVLAGGILAVVAAGGLLTAAFMSMTDAQKAMLKDAFVPLRQEMVGIGQLMITQMVPAFKTWSTNLQAALALAIPLATQLGTAFATAGNTITAALSGPGFQQLSRSLAAELPTIITRLASALGGFLNGAASTFAVILPYVTQFAGWLNQIATRFAAWAASATGQNRIEQFMQRATESIRSVWNFITQFIGYIGDVLFSPDAMNAGNSIFDSLAASFENFRADFARAAADGSLKKWFDDAIEFGKDLGETIAALTRTFKDLYSSGTLESVGQIFKQLSGFIEDVVKVLGPLLDLLGFLLPKTLKIAFAPLNGLIDVVIKIGDAFVWAANKLRDFLEWVGLMNKQKGIDPGPVINNTGPSVGLTGLLGGGGATPGAGAGNPLADQTGVKGFGLPKAPTLDDIKWSGANALAATSTKKAKDAAKKFKNPYLAFANQILADAPGVSASIKNALLDINEQVTKAINDAAHATGGDSVTSALTNLADSIVSSAEQTVNSAQQALYSAANSLASASSMKAANKALKEVKRAQKGVNKALADQARIQAVADILARQAVVNESTVQNMVNGLAYSNATLADFAEARSRVADMIADANSKLAEAIQIRDQYQTQIADSIKSFGSLITTQIQTINGIQQALNAGDIVTNLQDRLTKIKKFQENLRILLAQGISSDVYKQLVEAGVEGGSAFADALVAGGPGAINTVNQLVGDINKTADQVGDQASTRLYQAGVDGATALLDGLKSLESTLITQGEILGASIAAAIQRGLGTIDVSGNVTPPASSTGGGGTSGGGGGSGGIHVGQGLDPRPASGAFDPNATWGTAAAMPTIQVYTPTEDPYAVAQEVWNEFAGRLM